MKTCSRVSWAGLALEGPRDAPQLLLSSPPCVQAAGQSLSPALPQPPPSLSPIQTEKCPERSLLREKAEKKHTQRPQALEWLHPQSLMLDLSCPLEFAAARRCWNHQPREAHSLPAAQMPSPMEEKVLAQLPRLLLPWFSGHRLICLLALNSLQVYTALGHGLYPQLGRQAR